MASKKSVIKLVKEFVCDLQAANISFDKAILFGSYAYGNPTKYSDIDVAIVAEKFEGLTFNDIDYLIKDKIKKKYAPISIQTFNSHYFNKGDAFINEIKRTGIEIKV